MPNSLHAFDHPGTLDRITLVPIDVSRANVLAAFGAFDAANARCFLENDRQSRVAKVAVLARPQLPSALVRRGPASQIPPSVRGPP